MRSLKLHSLCSALLVLGFAAAAQPAHALSISGTIGPDTGCTPEECLGATWELTVNDSPDDPTFDAHVILSVTFPSTGLLNDDGPIDPDYVTGVAFGVPGTITAFNLTSSPTAGWTEELGPLANGCQNATGNQICGEGMAGIVLGGSLTWEWDIMVSDTSQLFFPEDLGDFYLGAMLESEDHQRGWMVSLNPIPEPDSRLAFLTGGLIVAAAVIRRPRARSGRPS